MKATLRLVSCALGASLICATGARAADAPEIFAPGVISGPSNDADAAFTPDGATLVFSRDGAILLSTRTPAGRTSMAGPPIRPTTPSTGSIFPIR